MTVAAASVGGALARHLPGVAAAPAGELAEAFRAGAGPGLVAPRDHGGLGCTLVEALQVQEALGRRDVDFAATAGRHHAAVAALVAAGACDLVEEIAGERLMAEWRPGSSQLTLADGRVLPAPGDKLGAAVAAVLVAAGHVGATAALVDRAVEARRADDDALLDLLVEIASSRAALERAAERLTDPDDLDAAVAGALLVRYGVERAVVRAVNGAAEALGGMAFIGGAAVANLIGAVSTLAHEPPARTSAGASLVAFAAGAELRRLA